MSSIIPEPLPMPGDFEPPALELYEVTWVSGHVERLSAHDVYCADQRFVFLTDTGGDRMRLDLAAMAHDVRTVRRVTDGESLLLDESEGGDGDA
ncbi:hypothetical protein ACFU99_32385 [Streptomyces sp. NPDC057654]|uniref:hypothetical protein n=1 Tax=Streptomyces sp. NPDC057654 TaxID=3346196 RepID=UPI0036C55B93